MKKLILPLLAILLIFSCTQESGDGVVPADGAIKVRTSDVAVCHNGHVIYVSVNALPAHLAHGDITGSCCPQGSWCFGAQGSSAYLQLNFQENCDAIATFEGFICFAVVTWEYLGSNGNTHTYHFDGAIDCGFGDCNATVVDNGTSLTVTFDCNPFPRTLTPCPQ